MSLKTDSPEFASGFLWQICLLTILALAFVLFSPKLFESERGSFVSTPYPIFYPWVPAGGHTIENALFAFSGKPPENLKTREQASTLAALLVFMIFCPTFFLLEWRRRKISGRPGLERPPLKTSSVFYALTGALTLYVGVGLVPVTVTSLSVRQSLRHAQAVQSNRDAIINELNMLDMLLEEYYILPKRLGGGEGSFEGFVPSQDVATTQEATYIVTGKKEEAEVRATSIRYPTCWVEIKVDTSRHMSNWTYGGEFR